MAVARANPLALGVYWIDVWAPSLFLPHYPSGLPTMRAWLEANADRVIEQHEDFNEGSKENPLPQRWFFKFQVLRAPTDFPFAKLGFPEIRKLAPPAQVAPADTAFKSDDTVRKPPPEPMFDFAGVLETVSPWLLAGLVLLLISEFKESKK